MIEVDLDQSMLLLVINSHFVFVILFTFYFVYEKVTRIFMHPLLIHKGKYENI